jgi:glycosyltransferase involved in cell wall biosynthesis
LEPEISIIVPIYNSEKWLQRCIESILKQSFHNFELILIDDGSNDRSGELCDEYTSKSSRISAFHIPNGGVSNARNTGIKLAKGKYLMFCDSDDYVEKDWCKDLHDAIKKDTNSLPVCGFRVVYNLRKKKKEKIISFNQEKLCKSKYFTSYINGVYGYVWNKIYDRNIIEQNSVYFDTTMSIWEDALFNIDYMNYKDKCVTITSVNYNYIHSSKNSIVRQYHDRFFHVCKMYQAWQEYFDKYDVDNIEKIKCATLYFSFFKKALKNTFSKNNPDNLFKKLKYNNQILKSKEFGECLELADLSKTKRDVSRDVRFLRTRNYYLVWFVERLSIVKDFFVTRSMFKDFKFYQRYFKKIR